MITIDLVLAILVIHLMSDFFLQSEWMANNKSKNWWALSLHVLVYSWATALSWVVVGIDIAPIHHIFGITFGAHFVTDAITSRITSYLYQKQKFRLFFSMIGIDQVLHYTQLFLMYKFLS